MESRFDGEDRHNQIVGFTCGAFDLLHSGHIIMFEEVKSWCDYLIVGLQSDPTLDRKNKNKPVQNLYERFIQLNAVKWIDEIIPYDTEESLLDILQTQEINIRFVGEEYEFKEFTGKGLMEQLGIMVHFNKRQHRFSSSNLRDRTQRGKIF